MKRTLLEMVQSILNDMDADPVDSIVDTFEAEQVAIQVRDTFFTLIDGRNWPHLKQLFATTVTDATSPSTLIMPEELKELIDVRVNTAKLGETQRKFKKVTWLYPDEFLDKTNNYNNDNANIDIITTPEGVELLIKNDHYPQFWTSFSDTSITFDSYDSELGDFITPAMLQTYGYIRPIWNHIDAYTPDLPDEAFTLLMEEAKSNCFYTLKNMVNEKAEARSVKADAWLSRKAFVTKGGIRYPNYGRSASNLNRMPHPLKKD